MFGAKGSPVSLRCPWGLLALHRLLPNSAAVLDAPMELEDVCSALAELNRSHLAIWTTNLYSYSFR